MSQQAQAMLQAQQKTTEPIPAKGSILQRAAVIPAITPIHYGIVQRCSGGVECEECRQKRLEREGMLQRAAVNAAPVNDVPPIVHEVLRSPGQALDAGTRAFMEPRFGYDFSQVRVHADAKAAESAQAVNALAYTVGRDVVFGEGEYEPGTSEGRRLLAHELTHVVQQQAIGNSSSIQGKLEVGQPNDAYEQEAEAQAANVIEGHGIDTVQIKGQPGITRLQRKIDPVKELAGTGCEPPTTSPLGLLFARVHFGFDKDDVSAKEKAEIVKFVTGSGGGSGLSNVRVDGYASTVGDERYNLHLSCRRAKAVRKELAKELHIPEASIATFAHGETSEFSDKKLKKGPEENQIAIISATSVPSPKPVPPSPKPVPPGPTPSGPTPLLTGILTPKDNFSGRSNIKYGIGEVVDLSFILAPPRTAAQLGGLKWSRESGKGAITGDTNGLGIFTADASPGPVRLKLTILTGPLAGTGPVVDITVIAPAPAHMEQTTGTKLRHTQGRASVGFKGDTYMRPKDVSFKYIQTREGTASGVGTGYYAFQSGRNHPLGDWDSVGPGNISTGSHEGSIDTIDTGDGSPPFSEGKFTWPIPWQYRVGSSTPTTYMIATHEQTVDLTGKATIRKVDAGPFTKSLNDPTSTY